MFAYLRKNVMMDKSGNNEFNILPLALPLVLQAIALN